MHFEYRSRSSSKVDHRNEDQDISRCGDPTGQHTHPFHDSACASDAYGVKCCKYFECPDTMGIAEQMRSMTMVEARSKTAGLQSHLRPIGDLHGGRHLPLISKVSKNVVKVFDDANVNDAHEAVGNGRQRHPS